MCTSGFCHPQQAVSPPPDVGWGQDTFLRGHMTPVKCLVSLSTGETVNLTPSPFFQARIWEQGLENSAKVIISSPSLHRYIYRPGTQLQLSAHTPNTSGDCLSSRHQRVPNLSQGAAGLSSQHSFSQEPPSPAQLAANCRSLCSSSQEAPSWEQGQLPVAGTGHLSRGSRTNPPSGLLQNTPEYRPTHEKCGHGWHQTH